jgi:hypothetical protein
MKRSILLLLAMLAGAVGIHAQSIGPSTLNATGGSGIIAGNDFEWSVGEMTLVSTFSGSSIVVTQGVLQPADITSGVVNHTPPAQLLQVFPNPATSVVNLQYESAAVGALSYRLMDMTGQVIKSATIAVKQGTTTEQLNIAALACATYMLEVNINTGDNSPVKTTYKIEKLN